MTELEKIAQAKTFIDKLANGINPIDDSEIPDTDAVNNVKTSRCLFFVSELLGQVIDNGGITPPPVAKEKSGKKMPYTLTPEQLAQFDFSPVPISGTEIIKRITDIGPKEGVKKFPRKNLTRWLLTLELIEIITTERGSKITRPTSMGEEMGIMLEMRYGQFGRYSVMLYNMDAQSFIIDNIDAVLALDNVAYKSRFNLDNQGKQWNSEMDEKLMELYENGLSLSEIAESLKRSERAVRIRLRRNGVNISDAI